MNYLGVTLGKKRKQCEKWEQVMERIDHRINGWKGKFLSQAAKLSLIQHVAATIPTYTMSVFEMPKMLCKKLDGWFRDFWWGKAKEKKQMLYLKSWKSLCSPKAMGGLNFRSMRIQNQALLSKLGWKMAVDDDSLWSKFFKEKYLKNSTLDFMQYEEKPTDSSIWKNILKSRKFVAKGLCWSIGNGKRVRVWQDPWIPDLENNSPVSINDAESIHPYLTVDNLMIQDECKWNAPLLSQLFSAPTVKAILDIPIGNPASPDKVIWIFAKNGRFSVKSSYNKLLLENFIPPDESIDIEWANIWKLKVHIRLKLLLGKVASNLLMTRSKLQEFLHIPDYENCCLLCNQSSETLCHLFIECPVAQILWRRSKWPINICVFADLKNHKWIEVILHPQKFLQIPDEQVLEFQIYALVTMDLTWMLRNQVLHNKAKVCINSLLCQIQKVSSEYFHAWNGSKESKSAMSIHDFSFPHPGFCKISFDAAIRRDFNVLSAVILDPNGVNVGSFVKKVACIDVGLCELYAAELGVSVAKNMGCRSILLEGDAKMIIEALKDINKNTDLRMRSVIERTVVSLQSFAAWDVSYIPRQFNVEAHEMARLVACLISRNSLADLFSLKQGVWTYTGTDSP